MSYLASSSFSNSSTFSSVNELTKGKIKCGYTFKNKLLDNNKKIIINKMYFATGDNHDDQLKDKHCFLYLRDKDFNYYKLELECQCLDKSIQLRDWDEDFKYTEKLKACYQTTLKDIINFIQNNFQNTSYNSLINDCSKFCYDILKKFTYDQIKHVPVSEKKVIYVYFGTSPIRVSGNLIEHGYIIVKTEDDYWKFEIGGCKDRVTLNFQKCSGSFQYHFRDESSEVTIGKIIECSEKKWGNTYYSTITNNCFDYCKFIMRFFTKSGSKNETEVEKIEKKNFAKGGLVTSTVATSSMLGLEIGSVAGPVGTVFGGIVGAFTGVVLSLFVGSD